jgi:hypothetical protein
MKHLLNNLSNEEKNRIREQYEGGMSVDNSRFKKLMESKLGNETLIKQFIRIREQLKVECQLTIPDLKNSWSQN